MKVGGRTPRDARGRDRRCCVPATANAAISATVTGDDGNPAQLTEGAPLALRNMDVQASSRRHRRGQGLQRESDRPGRPADAASAVTCGLARQRRPAATSTTAATARTRSRCTSYSDIDCTKPLRTVDLHVDGRRPASRSHRPRRDADAPAELVLDDHAAVRLRRQPGRVGLRDQVRQGRGRAGRRQPLLARAQGRLLQPHDRQGRADRGARAGHVHDRRPRPHGDYYSPWSAPVTLQPDRAVRPLLALVPRLARPELPGPRARSASRAPRAAA